jgi:hypothetical protein
MNDDLGKPQKYLRSYQNREKGLSTNPSTNSILKIRVYPCPKSKILQDQLMNFLCQE